MLQKSNFNKEATILQDASDWEVPSPTKILWFNDYWTP